MARQQVPFSFVHRLPIPLWERQLIRGGVWDIRTSMGLMPVIGLAGILFWIIVACFSDVEDRTLPIFLGPLYFPCFVNSGLVLDRDRQEAWLWRQILFWRRAWHVPPEDWRSMRVEYGRRKSHLMLLRGRYWYEQNWSVFVRLPGKEYTAMAGARDTAVEYAEAMGAFLSGKDLGKPPSIGMLQDKDIVPAFWGAAAIITHTVFHIF